MARPATDRLGLRRAFGRVGLGLAALAAGAGLLAACRDLSASLLPNPAVYATATACRCQCYPYGSYPHTTPSATPTPTGTWVPPTPTPSPTPTRPPACDFCTMAPAATPVPPHWPPPIVTCTPRADQPTLSPVPTRPPARLPTLPPNTPIPAVIGDTNPEAAGSLEGDALPGGVATDPRTGRAAVIWSQLDPDPGQETAGRVYLQLQDPASGQWLPARSVNGPGVYKIGKSAPESAVGLAPDGTLTVAYVRSDGGTAWIDWRASTDRGRTWSAPAAFPDSSDNNEIYNLRLTVDVAGTAHLSALVVTRGGDPANPSGDLVYYEQGPDGGWRGGRRPVSARGARQYSQALTTLPLAGGTIRTVLVWNEAQAVYASQKDGPTGPWSRPRLLIDGATQPDGIPDYEPGFGGTLQLLAFPSGGQAWVYAFWSLYSTGRICYAYSTDGGTSWSGEDALAYEPIGPARRAHLSDPVPFWDAAHARVFVIYRYAAIGGSAGAFPVYAYAPPGAPGHAWIRYEDPAHEPLRLFRPTLASQASHLRGPDQHGQGTGPVWLIWSEATGARELYRALVSPATLLSGTALP